MRKATGGGRGAGTPGPTSPGRQQEHRRVWQHHQPLQFPPDSTGAEPTGASCRCQGGPSTAPHLRGVGLGESGEGRDWPESLFLILYFNLILFFKKLLGGF